MSIGCYVDCCGAVKAHAIGWQALRAAREEAAWAAESSAQATAAAERAEREAAAAEERKRAASAALIRDKQVCEI